MRSTRLMQSREMPYFLEFSRERWASFRANTPQPLVPAELEALRGHLAPVSLKEVEQIYLPLSRLLSLYVAASQDLHGVTGRFLGESAAKVPFVIAVSGSVAVGKSTTSRLLQALLARGQSHPQVAWVTTDGFLYPNATLHSRGLMHRKGFPESYDLRALLRFLSDVKAGVTDVEVPIYSHHTYDIVPGEVQKVSQPDIVIVEGLNVLQVAPTFATRQARLFVSDFFDFSIYVDAPTEVIKQWYVNRFALFAQRAQTNPEAYFHRFAQLSAPELAAYARKVWEQVNAINLQKNILPFRPRARLILQKDADHQVRTLYLRRI
jgi:type I pantothenate kinase